MSSVNPDHEHAVRMATAANAAGDNTWFERLYADARAGAGPEVPWRREQPNARLVRTVDSPGTGRALVVGCGYGHDAGYLAALGYAVTAFDLSATAVAAAAETYAGVEFAAASVLTPPAEWRRAFDLVFEAYTIQVLRAANRAAATAAIADFVAPGGRLVVTGFAARPDDPAPRIAQPLTRAEIDAFATGGLVQDGVELLAPDADALPDRWHWLAGFHRPLSIED
ncbi:methyltransferase domain-containing protein [Actinokineospora sp. NBRC 105648]|uniref:class I SAM-dependent methyltransferase n=1 Tax=Actinokineospora sp. NBRC 105648 TaxID=3032206 RepID=UPI0024A0E470|nr:methyltransferase domain-containing protein [Actinokineospora sp. NBRC 105648]GLZ40238.1 hypothetical protein Acsp05_38620 [Actinokineospora sp. NBRC 105648]